MDNPRRPAVFALALAIAFATFFTASTHRVGEVNPFGEDPYDAVGSFGIQLAMVAAGAVDPAAAPLDSRRPVRLGTGALVAQRYLLFVDFLGLVRRTGP